VEEVEAEGPTAAGQGLERAAQTTWGSLAYRIRVKTGTGPLREAERNYPRYPTGVPVAETAPLWVPIRRAYGWVHAAARVLANHENQGRTVVQQAFVKVLRSIGVTKRHCGPLEDALTHFLKVTRSYRAGLFHCYDDPAIPRTNNDLEHYFGQHRYHERRATGQKRGSPHAVLHGPVRLVAGAITRLRSFTAAELAPPDRDGWQRLRATIRARFACRAQGRRFRRDPDAYLAQLEETALKRALPT
jgi:hypothetical protein